MGKGLHFVDWARRFDDRCETKVYGGEGGRNDEVQFYERGPGSGPKVVTHAVVALERRPNNESVE